MKSPTNHKSGWSLSAAVFLLAGTIALGAGVAGASSTPKARAVPAQHIAPSVTWPTPQWSTALQGAVTQSSPTVATVAGKTVVAVGDEDGYVYLFDAETGAEMPGWPQHVEAAPGQSAPIETSPTIAYLQGPHHPPSIIVGTGSTWVKGTIGEVEAFTLGGHPRFVFHVGNAGFGTAIGVEDTVSVGPLTGSAQQDIVFGSWDHNIYALSPSGKLLPGFPYNNADTIWSAPALYHLPGTAGDTVFIGSDASGVAYPVNGVNVHCTGGFIGAYHYTGAALAIRWRHCEPQSVWSSPAVGDLAAGEPAVFVGTSFFEQPFPAETDELLGFNALTGNPLPGFPVKTTGPVVGSPAIGDIAPGVRGVVDTTWVCHGPKQTDCFAGGSRVDAWTSHGAALWSDALLGPTAWGSPVLTPLIAHPSNDVLVGTPNGLYPLEGKTGAPLYGTNFSNQFAAINPGCRVFNSPAVADVAGTGPRSGWHVFEACGGPPSLQARGTVVSYALPVAPQITPAWPMFHADPQHDGQAIPPSLALLAPTPLAGSTTTSSSTTTTS